MIRRVAVLGFLAFSGFMTLGCSDGPIASPVEPQIAQKGKPTPTPIEPTLEEFWVYTDGGVDSVHIVVSGDADAIKKAVAHDYYFNGWSDGFYNESVDLHIEFPYSGAPTPEAKPIDGVKGMIHVDIPFRGEQLVLDGVTHFFRKSYVTSVAVSGADPFVFSLGAHKDGVQVASWVPLGVISGGKTFALGEIPTELKGLGHDDTHSNVRSYATWTGEGPPGDIWVQSLDLDEKPVCQTKTITEGRGKTRTTRTAAVVTGTINVLFGHDETEYGDPEHHISWEGHFYDVDSGDLSARGVARYEGGTWSLSLEMPKDWPGGEVAFAIDHLHPSVMPSIDFGNFLYNPEENGVPTIAGRLGDEWVNGASTGVGDGHYPLALSPSFLVTCK